MRDSLLGSPYTATKYRFEEDLLGRKIRLDFVPEYGRIFRWLRAELFRVPVPSSRI
jgi:hypothetical protein